jgi:hypothetical protein
MVEKAGGCLGVTDSIRFVDDSGWMARYFGMLGIQAGLESSGEGEAMGKLKELSECYANRGTEMHAFIDDYLTSGILPIDDSIGSTASTAVASYIASEGIADYTTEHCMTSSVMIDGKEYRYGGTVDFLSDEFVIDWKTTKKARKPYMKELLQMCAYDGGEGRKLINVYISQEDGSITNIQRWTPEQAVAGWEMFKDCLVFRDKVRAMNKMIK